MSLLKVEQIYRYVANGKVAFVFRHLPLEAIHPNARSAAVAAECAGAQGRFWEMHDLIFQSKNQLGPDKLQAHGARLNLDESRFNLCLTAPSDNLAADLDEAGVIGLTGTPVLLLGVSGPGATVDVKKVFTGRQFIDVLDRSIVELLKLGVT